MHRPFDTRRIEHVEHVERIERVEMAQHAGNADAAKTKAWPGALVVCAAGGVRIVQPDSAD